MDLYQKKELKNAKQNGRNARKIVNPNSDGGAELRPLFGGFGFPIISPGGIGGTGFPPVEIKICGKTATAAKHRVMQTPKRKYFL